MTATKHPNTSSYHQPLLSEPQNQLPQSPPPPPQYVIVLPPYPLPRRPRRFRQPCDGKLIFFPISLLLIAAAGYLLWPSDPHISVARIRLDHLRFHTRPVISLDLTLQTSVRVTNRDFYSVDYDSLNVAIGYRGRDLGFATSKGGRIRARGYSYVDATVQLDGVEVLSDAIYLLEDLAKGKVPFSTVSEIKGKLGLFFFDLPIKAKISCEMIVDTRNQTIAHQNCCPEV